MTAKECCERLEQANVRPTSIRILVYEAISSLKNTFSLSDLEGILTSVNKSSLFRALTLFHKHDLIHKVDDGSGCVKYCLRPVSGGDHEALHSHFHCDICQTTYCLEQTQLPRIVIPEGFVYQRANYVINGICAACHSKQQEGLQ